MTAARKSAEPWDIEWAGELAGETLAYLARHYPECSGSEALRPYEEAAHDAAMEADEERYKQALRGFMKAGRDEAMRIRRGAA
jgi:hypothetical protein